MVTHVRIALLCCALLVAGCSSVEEPAPPELASLEQAATSTVIVRWSGGQDILTGAGKCYMCGADYACDYVYPSGNYGQWAGGMKSFTDPYPAGSLVTGVTVSVNGCHDSITGNASIYLNNVYVGTVTPAANCYCGAACSTKSVTLTNAAGLPGYVYGGTNVVRVNNDSLAGGKGLCLTAASLVLTAADSPPPSVSPTSLAFGTRNMGSPSAPQMVTLTNPGPYPTTVRGVNPPPGYSVTGPAFPAVLGTGGTATFNVTFSPVANGPANGNLAFDASVGTVLVPVTGTGVGPELSLTPTSLSFPATAVGSTATAPLTLKNLGATDLVVSALAESSPDFSAGGVTLPLTLAPGASQAVTVSFTPTQRGSLSTTLSLAHNAGGSPTDVALSGTGQGARLVVSPTSYNYGVVLLGSSADQSFTVSNSGELPLTVSAVALAGASSGDFSVQTATPFTVAPGGSTPLVVRFAPTVGGGRSAALSFSSNNVGTSPGVSLSGTGGAPMVGYSVSSVAFGTAALGGTEVTRTLTVSSTGTSALILSGVTFGGAQAGSFSISPLTFPITQNPNTSLVVTLRFNPTVAGANAGTFQVVSNAANTPAPVALSGTGQSGQLAFTPASLDFGTVLVGAPSTARVASLKNTGAVSVTVSEVALAGADAASFTLAGAPSGTVTLAPSQTMTLQVTAAPASAGAKSAAVRVTSNVFGAPTLDLPLTTTGVTQALNVSPAALAFGAVHVPTAGVTKTLLVQNATTAPLTVTGLELSGPAAASFTATPSAPFTLGANGTQTVSVTYRPTAEGEATAELKVSSATESATVTLSGSALTRYLIAKPAALELGTVKVGEQSPRQELTLENVSDESVTVQAISSSEPAFTVEATLPLTLAARASAAVGVRFTPQAAGAASGSLEVRLAGQSGPDVTVALAGTGEAAGGNDPLPGGTPKGCGCSGGEGPLLAFAVPLVLAAALRRRRLR